MSLLYYSNNNGTFIVHILLYFTFKWQYKFIQQKKGTALYTEVAVMLHIWQNIKETSSLECVLECGVSLVTDYRGVASHALLHHRLNCPSWMESSSSASVQCHAVASTVLIERHFTSHPLSTAAIKRNNYSWNRSATMTTRSLWWW